MASDDKYQTQQTQQTQQIQPIQPIHKFDISNINLYNLPIITVAKRQLGMSYKKTNAFPQCC